MSDVNYDQVLEDLRRRRQQLDGAIAAIESMVGKEGSDSPSGEDAGEAQKGTTEVRSDTFFGMKMSAAITKYLAIKKRPQSAAEITRALEDGGLMTQAKNLYANVSTAVRRLEIRGELVQLPDTKQWAIASWYPTPPKPKNSGRKVDSDEGAGEDG